MAFALALTMFCAPPVEHRGSASWYMHGKRTASGERFNPAALTAAHPSLPFGTRVTVRHGKRSVTVRINDRGPFVRGRCLDLSRAAFARLAPLARGVLPVRWAVIRKSR